ncbi:hypothetical protein GKQ77_17890 [Streptomyces sp. BG9H]|uniref:Uncharacterized protein n=1 Tax=Streptomyces anatolicus TaxID=2675858 RepID=A0ABS6YS88_9ACTN|nr:hypothetical protein [Streptomyces anatolicus]MBW5423417.1 hypothetical protein [Streptomyces anatolicus]
MTRTGELLALLTAAGGLAGAGWLAVGADAGERYEAGLVLGLAAGLAVALLRRFTTLPPGRRRPYTYALPLPPPDWRAPLPDPHGEPASLRPYAEQRARLLSDAAALGSSLRHSCALAPRLRAQLTSYATTASIQASNCTLHPAGEGGPCGPDPAYDAAYALGELVAAVEFSRIGMRALEALVTERPLRPDPPCYFNPLHERGHARVLLPDASQEAAVCHGCALGPAPLLVPSAAGSVPYYDSDAVDARWRLLGYGAVAPDSGAAMIAAAHDGFRAPPRSMRGSGGKAPRAKVS